MAIFEFSDGFDAVGWYMDHPSAMDGDDYPEFDEFEDFADDYAFAGAEDIAMEYAWGDC